MRSEFRKILFITSAVAALAVTARADTLFDNSTTDLLYRFNPGAQEVGDQIKLASTGTLTSFGFEFYGLNLTNGSAFNGAPQVQVKMYLMDGTPFNGYNTPGTVIWTSDWSSIAAPTTRSTLVYTAGSDNLPAAGLLLSSQDITWSVQFRGLGTGDELGVDVFSAPTVGQDFPDYWRNNGTSWVLETNAVPVDFAARFQGTIPEPSVVSLAIVGGVVMMISGRKRKV